MGAGGDAENDAGVMGSIIELDSVEHSPLLCLNASCNSCPLPRTAYGTAVTLSTCPYLVRARTLPMQPSAMERATGKTGAAARGEAKAKAREKAKTREARRKIAVGRSPQLP